MPSYDLYLKLYTNTENISLQVIKKSADLSQSVGAAFVGHALGVGVMFRRHGGGNRTGNRRSRQSDGLSH